MGSIITWYWITLLQHTSFVHSDLASIFIVTWSSCLGESRSQCCEEGFLAEWLPEKSNGSPSLPFGLNLQTSLRGDKNDRRVDIFSSQTSLQLEAAHLGHAHVQDQTSGAAQLRGVEKVFSRKESSGGVADRLQQADDGFNKRLVVVNDRNQRNIGCAQICRRQNCDSLNLAMTNATTGTEMASIIPWYGSSGRRLVSSLT